MIPATFVGMALALGSLIATMLLEGSSPLAVVLLPPLVLVFGAHLRRGRRRVDHGGPAQARLLVPDGLRRRAARRRPARWSPSSSSSRPWRARRACCRWRTGRASSRTRSCAAASSWPSTPSRSSSCAAFSIARSPPPGPTTWWPPGSSPRWAATRRRSASSAPSSASCRCSRTWRTRRSWARSWPVRSSRPCGACSRPTSSGCR